MDNPRDPQSTSRWRNAVDDHDDVDDSPQFEKFQRGVRAPLPVSSTRNADRMAKKTFGSRRVKKQISQKVGGMHRRRQKTLK